MSEKNITRRRVMQGAGTIGIATIGGGTVVTAQNETGGNETGEDQQQAALRVAHASPDAPGVNVRIDGGDDGDAQIDGLEFRSVSDYNQVEAGSHRVEIVVTNEGFLGGLIEDIFGGDDDDDDETVIFDEEIDFEANTTYTAVAFGEVARGPIPAEDAEMEGNETGGNATAGNETAGNETGGNATGGNETGGNETGGNATAGNETGGNATAGNETGAGGPTEGEMLVENLAYGQQEYFELEAGDYTLLIRETMAAGAMETDGGMATNETAGNETGSNETAGNETGGNATAGNATAGNETAGNETAGNETGQEAAPELGFQVKVLEDDISSPGEEMSRMRIFHAVPDVEAMSISAVSAEEVTPGEGAGNQTGDGGVGGNETGGGDGGIGGNETDGGLAGNETGGGPAQQEGVQQRQISPAGDSVYSGFAVGYFDPEEAPEQPDGGNETGGNETGGNETGGGNETAGNESGEEVAEDAQGEQFELVTVKDGEGGERADGGTGGGLF